MKKKLADKVLLPLQLTVEAKTKVRKAGLVKHSYILTAVMRHQGKSAYSGHYVAQAMDWQTGRWFEFNDEIVSFLEKGPSSAFDHAKQKGSPPSGSSDAYNMYYVEEAFLAQSVLETCQKPSNGHIGMVDTMAAEREELYSSLVQ
jgi:hypothetical protein